jgi:hypothetical protein
VVGVTAQSKTESIKADHSRVLSEKQKQNEYRNIRKMVREIGEDDSEVDGDSNDEDENYIISTREKKSVETLQKKGVVSSANPSASDNSSSDNTSDSGINAEDDGSDDEVINVVKQVSNRKTKKSKS